MAELRKLFEAWEAAGRFAIRSAEDVAAVAADDEDGVFLPFILAISAFKRIVE